MKSAKLATLFFIIFTVLSAIPSEDQETQVTWFGFSQITAELGHGVSTMDDRSDNGVRFGADRIRFGYKGKLGSAFAKLQVDFKKKNISSVTAGMPDIIQDAEVGYWITPSTSFKAGMFKTPVGMDFNTSGSKLDITKRGMEKSLVLERALGVMVSGRNLIPGLGYDLGVFNPPTRSSAVFEGTPGLHYAYAARARYDLTGLVHAEMSYGIARDAGSWANFETEDYTVWDAGVSYRSGGITLKGEWISGSNINGVEGSDQQVWYLHAGYRLLSRFEPVIRHYEGKFQFDGHLESQLSNTFVGINIFLNPEDPYAVRFQLDFVTAGESNGDWYGLGGYTDNAFLAQFQFAF